MQPLRSKPAVSTRATTRMVKHQFHAEQCTGVFRVTREAEMLLVQSALELATIRDKHPERTWAGDQAATNLVMHERRFRDGTNISVEVFRSIGSAGRRVVLRRTSE